MRLLLSLILFISVYAQLPKQHAANKQATQPQIEKPANNQGVPDTSKPPETRFYTYNNQNSEGQERPSEISDYLLAVFTFALVVVGYLQWRVLREHEKWMEKHDARLEKLADAAKKSAEVAESTLKLGKRADVLLDGAVFSHGQVLSGTDARVILQFRNFGETRARDTRLSLNLLIDGVPPTDCAQIPAVVIGAGDTQKVSSEPFGNFLTQQTAQNLFSGKTTLRFEGEAIYKDIFGDPHRSYNEGTLNIGTGAFRIDKQEAD